MVNRFLLTEADAQKLSKYVHGDGIERIAQCVDFCRDVPDEAMQAGLGAFVQAKMEFGQRLIMPKVAEAIEVLKEASV